jgi:uncharacterized protein YkwD
MEQRMTVLRIFVVVLVWLLGACSGEAPLSQVSADGALGPRNFYFALGNVASSSDPQAFKLIAAAANAVDDASVKFCFGDAARCAQPDATVVAAVATQVQGGKIYVSEKFVKLSANLPVTILGTSAAGSPVAETVTIVTKGSAIATNTGTSTLASTNTDTSLLGGLGLPGTGTSTGGTVPAGNDPADCAGQDFEYKTEAEIFRLVNVERANAGMNQLTYHTKLACIARLWSDDQASRGDIGHEWFENGTFGSKYQQHFNEQSPAMAENVAMTGCDNDPVSTAASFMNMWMNSQGHKDNILRQGLQTLGVGLTKTSNGMCYGTQDFGR